ncbi:hypothetical protein HGRIS_011945 [Hohenbuehelia grisea]|uniref:Uncharacterized protein n=1 Tax=Hohenbuehelia grisea TaxID=104357 RepID=A0ABR3JXR1_9AGAR
MAEEASAEESLFAEPASNLSGNSRFLRTSRTRLTNTKLTTSPYDGARAYQEYGFIDPNFRPLDPADPLEHDGRSLVAAHTQPSQKSLTPREPHDLMLKISAAAMRAALGDESAVHGKENVKPMMDGDAPQSTGPAVGGESRETTTRTPKVRLILPAADKLALGKSDPNEQTKSEAGSIEQVFCPRESREGIIDMMEAHLCAHPLIDGYAHPSAASIRKWAVRQMYLFCHTHDLREAWAYLWENWYCSGRWELWARAANDRKIPVLKTTMMLESHWRRIKHDFLNRSLTAENTHSSETEPPREGEEE